MATTKKNEVAKTETAVAKKEETKFDLVTLEMDEGADISEIMKEELDGFGPVSYQRIKIPSGGGLTFEMPTEEGEEPESVPTIDCVILHHHSANSYWENKYEGGNTPPDCSSRDGKTGVLMKTGEVRSCEGCEFNEFGSDGNAKACKNTRQLFILMEGNPLPMIISVAPSSLANLKNYIVRHMVGKGRRSYQIITQIGLKKAKSSTGIAYSALTFKEIGKLAPDQVEAAKSMSNVIKEMVNSGAFDSKVGYDRPDAEEDTDNQSRPTAEPIQGDERPVPQPPDDFQEAEDAEPWNE